MFLLPEDYQNQFTSIRRELQSGKKSTEKTIEKKTNELQGILTNNQGIITPKIDSLNEHLKEIRSGIHMIEGIIKKQEIEPPNNIDATIIIDQVFPLYRLLNKIEDSLICQNFGKNSRTNIQTEFKKLPEDVPKDALTSIVKKDINTPEERLRCLIALNKLRQEAIHYLTQEVSNTNTSNTSDQQQEPNHEF